MMSVKMKDQLLLFSVLVFLAAFVLAVYPVSISANELSYSEQATALEKEIEALNSQIQPLLEDVYVVLGNITSSQTPGYFSVNGYSFNRNLNLNPNYVVQDPENGVTALYFYQGTHNYVGEKTFYINGQYVNYTVLGPVSKEYIELRDTLTAKEAELEKLKVSPPSFKLGKIILTINSPKLVIDGTEIKIDRGVKPIIVNGTTFIPLESMVKGLGGTTILHNDKLEVEVLRTTAAVTAGSKNAIVNDEPVELNVAPRMFNSTVVVPLEFVAKTFGMDMNYNTSTRTITLSYDDFWYDDLDEYIKEDGDKVTFNEQVIGMTYTFPKEWGDPVISHSTSDSSYYFYNISHWNDSMDHVYFSCTPAFMLEPDKLESLKQEFGSEKKLPLSDKNSGIESISYWNVGLKLKALIICNNGAVIEFGLEGAATYLDESSYVQRLPEAAIEQKEIRLINEVFEMLNSIQASENVG